MSRGLVFMANYPSDTASVSSLLLLTDGRSARDLPKQLRAKAKNMFGGG